VKRIHSLSGKSGASDPNFVNLAQGRDGHLYGDATGYGYTVTDGSVFRLTTSGTGGVLYRFAGPDGSHPTGGVILATDGNYYGVTPSGGALGIGTLFRLTASGTYKDLYDFSGGSDGGYPYPAPMEASDGNLYGLTSYATLYRYTRAGEFSTLYSFNAGGTSYSNFESPLLQASDGNLYAVSGYGGPLGCGAIFKLTTAGVLLHTYDFQCSKRGSYPQGPLLEASDGNFYGVTSNGGSSSNTGCYSGCGTVFKMSQEGIVTIMYTLQGDKTDGTYPLGGLAEGTDGYLYGSTFTGGTHGDGTLFQISKGGSYRLLYSFPVSVGYGPEGKLLQHTNGLFYGLATYGGITYEGTVYSLDMGLGAFVTFVRPTGKVGQTAQILGQGLTGSTSVTFNGVPATSLSVVSDTYMTAVVPSGAITGPVVVTTPSGALTSNVSFRISQ
jgi:uncharacterized repeat protein (TIGR03803 family)